MKKNPNNSKMTNPNHQTRPDRESETSTAKNAPLKFDTPSDLLLFLRRLPINRKVEQTSLSPFLRRFRKNTHLDIAEVATALNISPQAISEFESSDNLPWKLSSSTMVALASAYRIHVEAVDYLTTNSYQVARLSKVLKDPDQARASMLQWLRDVRSQMEAICDPDLTT